MIYTVTVNPSVDYVVQLGEFHLGMVNRALNEAVFSGGKGINVAMILQNLGVSNRALGFLAGFTGDLLRRICDGAAVGRILSVWKRVSAVSM